MLTSLAMSAFATNSLLTRLALGSHFIDPVSFTLLRALAAAVILTNIVVWRWRRLPRLAPSWASCVALFGYLVFFSLAYTRLAAGTGTLILFGAVQLAMLSVAVQQGDRLPAISWIAFGVALSGLLWLVAPGLNAPDPVGCLFMTIAGVSWGAFSLLGRGTSDPLDANAASFLGCLPIVIFASVLFHADFRVTVAGLGLAVASGAVASGLGYVIWYAALKELRSIHAAAVQLSVPILATIAGAVFLGEPVTLRLVLSSLAVLGGVAAVLMQSSQPFAAASLQRAGETPNSRLKARLNASSES